MTILNGTLSTFYGIIQLYTIMTNISLFQKCELDVQTLELIAVVGNLLIDGIKRLLLNIQTAHAFLLQSDTIITVFHE